MQPTAYWLSVFLLHMKWVISRQLQRLPTSELQGRQNKATGLRTAVMHYKAFSNPEELLVKWYRIGTTALGSLEIGGQEDRRSKM